MNPGSSASARSDLAASEAADGADAVPGVVSARRLLMAGLRGEVLELAGRFDAELEEAGW